MEDLVHRAWSIDSDKVTSGVDLKEKGEAHMNGLTITKAELARRLGVSRTYVTLLTQGKRQPSQQLANKIKQLQLTAELPVGFRLTNALVGKGGLEPPCLAAHDPKSCSSASSDTPPRLESCFYFTILLNIEKAGRSIDDVTN